MKRKKDKKVIENIEAVDTEQEVQPQARVEPEIQLPERPYIILEQPHGEIERFYLEALAKAHAIKLTKAIDYNSGRVTREDYYLYEEKSLINEIWKKVLRLVSLFDLEAEPENESIENNLLDLLNYCADLYSYMRWKEEMYEAQIRQHE